MARIHRKVKNKMAKVNPSLPNVHILKGKTPQIAKMNRMATVIARNNEIRPIVRPIVFRFVDKIKIMA